MGTHWIVLITAISQDVHVLDSSLKISAPPPNPKIFEMSPQPLTFFFCLNYNFQMKKFNVSRWRSFDWKLLSPSVSWDMQKPVWFVHVTDCYCSGRRNLNKFFLTTKFPFAQSHPILMGQLWTNLAVFIDRKACLWIWKREATVVQV